MEFATTSNNFLPLHVKAEMATGAREDTALCQLIIKQPTVSGS